MDGEEIHCFWKSLWQIITPVDKEKNVNSRDAKDFSGTTIYNEFEFRTEKIMLKNSVRTLRTENIMLEKPVRTLRTGKTSTDTRTGNSMLKKSAQMLHTGNIMLEKSAHILILEKSCRKSQHTYPCWKNHAGGNHERNTRMQRQTQ